MKPPQESYSYEDLIEHGHGLTLGEGNAPASPSSYAYV